MGDKDCCGECSRKCKTAAKDGKCLPECQAYKGDISCYNPIQFPTTTVPPVGCPQLCKDAARSNQCLPDCKVYKGDTECCNEGYLPPETTTKTSTTTAKTSTTTTEPPPCPSDCLDSAAEGKCLPKSEQYNSP